eukprot:TRINITY_DN6464_c0_g2_i1.p1 TRINITY_DN6464_c0_g2~~TRINITY_DN6464_c0_g2_i1.p1  ORF type:complete len:158 (-),score=35.96 TRINITY_DN6464_c0_g2_i1:192-665(-)
MFLYSTVSTLKPIVAKTSTHFQSYIKKGLDGMEKQSHENKDPNMIEPTTSTSSENSNFASSHIAKLKQLKAQYGMDDSSSSASSSGSVSVDDLRNRLRLVSSSSASSIPSLDSSSSMPTSSNGKQSLPSNDEEGSSSSSGSSSVADLRQRLARLRQP